MIFQMYPICWVDVPDLLPILSLRIVLKLWIDMLVVPDLLIDVPFLRFSRNNQLIFEMYPICWVDVPDLLPILSLRILLILCIDLLNVPNLLLDVPFLRSTRNNQFKWQMYLICWVTNIYRVSLASVDLGKCTRFVLYPFCVLTLFETRRDETR